MSKRPKSKGKKIRQSDVFDDLTNALGGNNKKVKADKAGLETSLGLEKEERVLVVPGRFMALATAVLAEGWGTFVWIFFTSLAIATIAAPFTPVGSRTASGLAFGLVFLAVHSIYAKYSGGHYNPAISWSNYLGYQMSPNLKGEYFSNGWQKLSMGTVYLAAYVISQVLFSFFAGWAAEMVLGGDGTGLGVPVVTAQTTNAKALFIEIIGCIVIAMGYFMLVIEKSKGHLDSFAIGFLYTGLYVSTAALSGGSFNPVRYMGPAIANLPGFSWSQSWVFIAGPFIGSTIGWGIYEIIRLFLMPSKQYVGWVPLMFGPKTKSIYAHYMVDDKNKKQFVRM